MIQRRPRKFSLFLFPLLLLTACSYGYSPELDQQKATFTRQFMETVRDLFKIKSTFDEQRISQIKKEKMTKQDILTLFGEPFFKTRNFSGLEEWSYRYVVAGRQEKAEVNLLVIEFTDGVVQTYTVRPFFR